MITQPIIDQLFYIQKSTPKKSCKIIFITDIYKVFIILNKLYSKSNSKYFEYIIIGKNHSLIIEVTTILIHSHYSNIIVHLFACNPFKLECIILSHIHQ